MASCYLDNKIINFSTDDFLARGGQGSVYVKGNTVYKVYTNLTEMITSGKMKELQMINHPNIIIPEKFLTDSGNNNIGFTMPYIKNTVPLIKIFNNGYRDSVGFDGNDAINLINKMEKIIQYIHDKKIIQVDGNELNYLMNFDHSEPYFIDTDSFQTSNYPATVIKPNIRDWSTSGFSELTDWYSFAIIACQIFIGIHPFKGRHPGYGKDIKQRSIDCISIFNKDTRVNGSVRDFSYIPEGYMEWFIKLFEKGERIPPPTVSGTLKLKINTKTIIGNNLIDILLIKEYSCSKIINYKSNENDHYLLTDQGIESEKVIMNFPHKINFLMIDKDLLLIKKDNFNTLKIKSRNFDFNHSITCEQYFIYDNKLYIKNGSRLVEYIFKFLNSKYVIKNKIINIHPNSSKFHNGVISQVIFNKVILTIPVESNLIFNKIIKELENFNVIDAKYEKRVCILILENKISGNIDRARIIFNKNYSKYSFALFKDVDYIINFTVLDKGLVLEINEDGIMEVYFNNMDKILIKELKDDNISASWNLTHNLNDAMFFKDNKIFKLKMK